MPDRRVKPCATCHHPKTRHRRGCCIHHWTTRGQTFMGMGTVVKYCTCEGYLYRPKLREAFAPVTRADFTRRA